MDISRKVFLVLCLGLLSNAPQLRADKQLPSKYQVCYRNRPGMDQCLKEAIQGALQNFVTGDPDLGVPPIDPMLIESMNLNQPNGAVQLRLHFENTIMEGLKEVRVDSVSSDLDNFKMLIHATVPRTITLNGNYTMDGRIMTMPVSGTGYCTLTLESVTADALLTGPRFTAQNGEEYLTINNFNFTFDTNRLRVDFQNLFNGDRALGTTTNKFLNDNWREILREFKPAIQGSFADTFKRISNTIFEQVPYKNIFPQGQ